MHNPQDEKKLTPTSVLVFSYDDTEYATLLG